MAKVEYLNEESFKEKIFNFTANKDWKFEGELPCIIDFFAEWCNPCKQLAPVLDTLQEEYAEKINIYKINTEEEKTLAGMFGVQSIPSLLFVPKEGQPQMAVGALPVETLKKAIADVLKVEE